MSEEENRFYFSKEDITFYGDTEKEKKLNEQLFDDSLLIAQKDDEIKDLQEQLQEKENIIKEAREYLINTNYDSEIPKLMEILDKVGETNVKD